jgi:glycosyltransferase involved in cell wall biosynthesis
MAMSRGTQPAVSVIVPVRNGVDDLRGLLEALRRQTLAREDFEVVIGDDGSEDAPEALETPDASVRVLPGYPTNSYAARNRAVRASRGRVLAFCDADCRPEPGWLEAGLAALEDAELAAGEIRFAVPPRRTVWTLLDMETFKDHARQVPASNAETANLFATRDLYDRIGGFDDSLPEHGDFDFVQRAVAAGARLVYAPAAQLSHPTRDRARPFLRTVWIMHRWYAAREARAGRKPDGLKLRSWVPLVQPLRARRRVGRSLGLDRRRLGEHGVVPGLRENLRALPIMYLLLPYFCGAAQARGWLDGRRLREA